MDEQMDHLEAELERGKRYLDRLELADAEEIFRDILQRVPLHRNPETDLVIVSSLFGLAEIHEKHCRNVRITQLDWACGMLFSLLFYRTTSETCAKVIRQLSGRAEERSNRNGSSNVDLLFSDTLARAKTHANAVEVNLLTALRGKVLENLGPIFSSISNRRKTGSFDDTWFEGLWDFCCRSATEYQSDVTENDVTESPLDGVGPEDDSRGGLPRRRRFSLIAKDSGFETAVPLPPPASNVQGEAQRDRPSSPTPSSASSTREASNKRRINFDRFQDAIKQFVSDVSQDIRWKYSHISGKIPHGLLEQRVCSELAMRLSPGCDDSQELQTIFETLLTEEDDDASTVDTTEEFIDETSESFQESSSEEDVDDDAVETVNLFIKPSALYSGKEADAVGDSSPLCNGLIVYDKGKSSGKELTIPNKANVKKVNSNSEIKAKSDEKQSEITSRNKFVDESLRKSSSCSGVLTKWRRSETDKPPIDEFFSSSTVSCGFEEVSMFSERKEKSCLTNGSEIGLHRYINEAMLSQLLAITAIKLADEFRKEMYSMDAIQLYKYAYGILKAFPVDDDHRELQARLLLDIGSTCCSIGEMESGGQLMKQAARFYEGSGEMQKQVDVWYQLGNAYLSDSLRQESILAKVMQMIKEDVKTEYIEAEVEDGSVDSNSEEGDTYCSCIYDAVDCYKRSLEGLEKARETGQGQSPELLANVLTNLADCQMMTGNLDLAERNYEQALSLFTDTFGTSLLQKNAHVLGMVGTLNFLARNYVRSATMFETSYILRQHLPDTDDPTLEIPWNLTMLAMSYHFLGHYHQSVTWCIRAFKLYTRFFRGRLLTVDALSRWFIVQNLFILGFAYNSLRLHKKALHYLNFCKNMIVDVDEDQDLDQSVQVYLALGDAYLAVEDKTNADKSYEEARMRLEALDKDSLARAILSEELEARLSGGRTSGQSEVTGRDRINHDRAVFHQRDVETSIKDDMVSILLRLGFTSNFEKDIDRAIGCYDECVQAYRDLKEPSEAARALASLGTLCQVKGRLQDEDSKRKLDFLLKAENYFREAYVLVDSGSPVHVQYGNFLYGEGRHLEALQVLLPFVFCRRSEELELSYSGIEQMALPVHLHRSIDESEALIVEARVLAKFLALLCFRSLKMTKDADEVLDELYRSVAGTSKALNYTLLGYAFLECRLFDESAEAFLWSSRLQPESDLAHFVAWMALLLAAYAVMARGLDHFLQAVLASANNDRGTWTFHEKKAYLRRQVSCRSRKIIRDPGPDQTKNGSPVRPPDPVQSRGSGSGSGSGHANRHDSFRQDASPGSMSPSVRRNFVIETRRWQPQEMNGTAEARPPSLPDRQDLGDQTEAARGAKKKWRSRLYHNLPDT